MELQVEDEPRFHQLAKLKVSDLIKTVLLFEKMLKQLTTEVENTDDPTSTLKLILQTKTEKIKISSRLYAFEETMRRNNISVEKIPQVLMEHVQYKNFYERAKEHFDDIIPIA